MEKFKKLLSSFWKWIKNNWLVIVLLFGVGFLAWSFRSNDQAYKNLFKSYTQQSADNRQQIEDLRAVQEQERADQERIMRNYLDELHRIEQEYKTELTKIETQRATTQDNIISNYNSNPTTLTSAVTNTFGIPTE